MTKLPHDLHSYMQGISEEIAREYARIRSRTKEDPGTAGDQGEENWADLLRGWLPSYYHIVTKGRILNHDGKTSDQVDVLILHPSYPQKLLHEKYYLAGGVVAAFECKTTLRANHIAKAMANSKIIKDFEQTSGSPYRELNSSILYGLLSHSHDWKRKKSKPVDNIQNTLQKEDEKLVKHPCEMIDVICVANLATWIAHKLPWMGPEVVSVWNENLTKVYGENGSAMTNYIHMSPDHPNQKETFTPLGAFFQYVLVRLAWDDVALRRLAKYFMSVQLLGSGSGNFRLWDINIYSNIVAKGIKDGKLKSTERWDEWGIVHQMY